MILIWICETVQLDEGAGYFPALAIQPDTMLARVKSGGVAAPLCGYGS